MCVLLMVRCLLLVVVLSSKFSCWKLPVERYVVKGVHAVAKSWPSAAVHVSNSFDVLPVEVVAE